MNRVLAFLNFIMLLLMALWLMTAGRSFSSVHASETAQIMRIKELQLVDDRGKMRARLTSSGHESDSPEFTMYGPEGRESVVLTLDSQGDGLLTFQDATMNGKVNLGYLSGDNPGPLSASEQAFAAWGLRVRGRNGQRVAVGLLNSGKPIWDGQPTHKLRP